MLTQPHQGFTHVHPSALHLARFSFVAKLPLRHSLWLRTLPLPGTHAEIGDRLGHSPGGVLRLLTQDKRFSHRTYSCTSLGRCCLENHSENNTAQFVRERPCGIGGWQPSVRAGQWSGASYCQDHSCSSAHGYADTPSSRVALWCERRSSVPAVP